MYTQVGSCPICGAPIVSPSSWMSVTPAPSIHTCNCTPHQTYVTTTGTSPIDNNGTSITYDPRKL